MNEYWLHSIYILKEAWIKYFAKVYNTMQILGIVWKMNNSYICGYRVSAALVIFR